MRNKWILIGGVLVSIAIIAAILVYIFVYNKPHTDFAKADPDYRLQAEELYREFKNNPDEAAAKYNGKVVAIEGALEGIETNETFSVAVFSFEDGMFGDEGIRCAILPDHVQEIAAAPPGSNVVIKGMCSGYNQTDVIMEHCSLAQSLDE